METHREPPGPTSRVPGMLFWKFGRDPLGFMQRLHRDHGSIVRLGTRARKYYFIAEPELIREVLVARADQFIKGPALRKAKITLGEGLLTSEDPLHRRQRRMIGPAFHAARISAYVPVMAQYARETADALADGERIDIVSEMTHLTLRIVAKTLFNADIARTINEIGAAMAITVKMFDRARVPWGDLLNRLPMPANRRFKKALAFLHGTVQSMIDQRRANPTDRGDFLSILLNARGEDGSPMSDRQIIDEAITLFSAGHETTANALVWTWNLLAGHPEALQLLHAEVDSVLCEDEPNWDGMIDRLPWTRAILAESMRLYPPVWVVARESTEAMELGGFHLPRGSVILMSQWIVHREDRWWRRPLEFMPERWLEDDANRIDGDRQRYAYFPFAGGPRSCIGESFAWAEGIVLLATIARRLQFRRAEPQTPVILHPTITLRPRSAIEMIVQKRRS